MSVLRRLKERDAKGDEISVGLVGCGSMGRGIAHQISITPGMRLGWLADSDLEQAEKLSVETSCENFGESCLSLIESEKVDVVVEATNSIWDAFKYCKAAIRNGSHIVLMNAEVDLAFGVYLKNLADENGVIVTSDAGDQHGVIATMIEEVEMWGFDIVQAGNMKGFLNRYATIESLLHEAEKRQLNPIQCCSYTDGTKMNIEMALLSNAYGYKPSQVGMKGPKLKRVEEVLGAFDFDKSHPAGEVDYILGAEPGGGVYLVGRCDHPVQMPYLEYYKLGDGPYYLFFRPYHLCHLETPRAIAKAVLYGEAILQPWVGRIADVYAFAKCDAVAGSEIKHGIGDDLVYGQIVSVEEMKDAVPVTVLDSPGVVTLKRSIVKDQIITWDDVEWSDRSMVDFFLSQIAI